MKTRWENEKRQIKIKLAPTFLNLAPYPSSSEQVRLKLATLLEGVTRVKRAPLVVVQSAVKNCSDNGGCLLCVFEFPLPFSLNFNVLSVILP